MTERNIYRTLPAYKFAAEAQYWQQWIDKFVNELQIVSDPARRRILESSLQYAEYHQQELNIELERRERYGKL